MTEQETLEQHVSTDVGAFAMIPLWFIEAGPSPRAIQCLAILLAKFADRRMECYPSRKTIADLMDTSVDTVDRAIKELKDMGVITTEEQRRSDGGLSANLIHIRLARPAASTQHPGDGVSAEVPTGTRTDADTRTRSIQPDPINHTAGVPESLSLFGDEQPASPDSGKKKRRSAQHAQSESDPIVRAPASVPLRLSDLDAIATEFVDLPDLSACIERCQKHISYRTATDKPWRLRQWLANDLRMFREKRGRYQRTAQDAHPTRSNRPAPYWDAGGAKTAGAGETGSLNERAVPVTAGGGRAGLSRPPLTGGEP